MQDSYLWQQCLQLVENELPDHEVNTWLRPLQPMLKDNILHLFAPNPFVLEHVQTQHQTILRDNAKRILSTIENVSIRVGSIPLAKEEKQTKVAADLKTEQGKKRSATHEKNTLFANPVPEKSPESYQPEILSAGTKNTLSKRLSFDNFVEGKSNQFARAAALQVSENTGGAYNPFFIYGGVGLGKTHLIHAIGNRIRELNPKAWVVYLHSERFVNDMVNAIRTNRINEFKQYYRSVDVLLIDDIQFFAGKGRSMEEFFYTFNALLEGQKQIVLASDRYPNEVSGLDDRLRSRFTWGLTVSIEPPELETRVAILSKKADEANLPLSNDAAFFIGKRFRSNIRDLEGALQRIIASAYLRKEKSISLEFVQEALKDQLAVQDKLTSIGNIKKMVAQFYNIRVADLDSTKRTRVIARPRQVAMALTKEMTSRSLPEIGKEFGGRDHTTVLHACRKVKELRSKDQKFDDDYHILVRTLTN